MEVVELILPPDLRKLTKPELVEISTRENGTKPPSKLNKADLITYIEGKRIEGLNSISYSSSSAQDLELKPKSMDPNLNWLQHLREHGWSVVDVPNFETEQIRSEFFGFLERCCSRFKRDDRKTWINSNLPPNLHGIIKHYIGHEPFVWETREACLPIFEQIWQTTDLLSSFDGGCFFSPTANNSGKKCWVHVDQRRDQPEMISVQGLVNLQDNGPNDGGLVLLEDSHLDFSRYMQRHPSQFLNWDLADLKDPDLQKREAIKVCLKAGQIALWDSRTFHCNTPSRPDGDFRMCIYVCLQPRKNCDSKTIVKRIKYFEEGKMTGHSCYGPWFHQNSGLRTWGKEVNRPDLIVARPELNSNQRRLVGYDE